MKIFVAGGTGVIGRRVVRLLTEAGHEVTALSRSEAKDRFLVSQGARPVRCDLFDRASLEGVLAGQQAVINLATAIPPLDRALKKAAWQENNRIRIEGSANLVDAALASGCARFIQESITFPYRDNGREWIDETVPFETTPMTHAPVAAEASAARFGEGGSSAVVLRFGAFYSADSSHTIGWAALAKKGLFPFPGPGNAYQSMIHADDAAQAVMSALDTPAGTYNVVEDEPLTRSEASAVMAAAAGRSKLWAIPVWLMRLIGGKDAGALMRSQRVSNKKLKAVGWRPEHRSFGAAWSDVLRALSP